MEWIVRTLDGQQVLSSLRLADRLATQGVIIGSSRENADVLFEDQSVADGHARLWLDDRDGLTIEDLGTGHETFVNDQRVRMPYTKVPLGVGQNFTLGKARFEIAVRRTTGTAPRSEKCKIPLDAELDQDVARNELEIMLSTFDRWGRVLQRRVRRPAIVHEPIELCSIGREPLGDNFVVDGEFVSRAHATIGYHPVLGWVIRDDGSRNGTLVNDTEQRIGKEWVAIERRTIYIGDHPINISHLSNKAWLD